LPVVIRGTNRRSEKNRWYNRFDGKNGIHGEGRSLPAPSNTERSVSVVIPTWRRGDLLGNCLESLRAQTGTDFGTVLVSNGAGDWVEQLAKEFGCELVKLPSNRGFAAAVNAGIAAGRSRYVTVLNDDVELDPHWLERTVAFLEAYRDVSFCCGKIPVASVQTISAKMISQLQLTLIRTPAIRPSSTLAFTAAEPAVESNERLGAQIGAGAARGCPI